MSNKQTSDCRQDYPRQSTVHQIISDQAAATPHKVALIFEDSSLTYRDLDSYSNQLAHRLQSIGIMPNMLIALCVERSIDMFVGLLGILKAGGAYVPIDPAYPADRIAFMLRDSRAQVIITQEELAGFLPEHQAETLCLDADWPAIVQESDSIVPTLATAEDLAYVIYTSGSTGQPKGVEVPHRAVVNLLSSMRHEPGMRADDRLLAVTTLSFDMAGLELYLPLTVGAQIVIASRDQAMDGEALARLVEKQRITVLQATPATWQLLLLADWRGSPNLRIFCGGETLPRELAETLLVRSAEVWNLYGPTEATIWSTVHRVETGSGPVPIGCPIANTEIQILDKALEPVAPGTEGELFIGGDGLARGYLNRPELTSERFLPHPFGSKAGTRLYRTGDIAKFLPDGSIQYIGRTDHQVTVRGYRIELGEIEVALDHQDCVRQSVVLARENVPGDKQLVAYVVPAKDHSPTSKRLRDALARKLPNYMVPAHYMILEEFSRTPNGKIDRNALPKLGLDRVDVSTDYSPPTTSDEVLLAAIAAEVLGLKRIGVHDNFLQLGGDSLKFAQIAARIRERWQVDIPLGSLFDNPTVAGLLEVLANSEKRGRDADHYSIGNVSRAQNLPLSFAQERVWFIHQVDPDNLAYNFQSTIRFRGLLDLGALERALDEIVRRHECYRTTFAVVDNEPVQIIHPPRTFTLPTVELSGRPSERREAAARAWCDEEFRHRFDLARLPLVRWTLLRLADNEHLLVHMEHHLIHDGWSFNVFLRELVDLYNAYTEGAPSPLPELPIQFADFASWQRRWMQSEMAAQQLAYWKGRFETIPPRLQLSSDGARPARQSFRGMSLRPEIPIDLCNALRALSRREGATLFMTMLAGFIALLHRYTAEPDVAIGTFFANRRARESESLIGMILNNVVIRASLADNPTVRQLMKDVRRLVCEAANNQDVPFNQVVNAAQPQRDLRYNPLFQVMFSFHDEPMTEQEIPGMHVEVNPVISNGSAKFDLGVIGIPHSCQRLGLCRGSKQDGLTMIWEFNTDLLDADSIEQMIEHYETLLGAMVDDPDERISDLIPTEKAAGHEPILDSTGNRWATPAAAVPMCRDSGVEQVAPRTTVEERVASVWAEVLPIDDVGVLDNFFEIGGHSLLAAKIVGRLRATFGVELSIASLFEHPTVAGVAEQITRQSDRITLII